MTRSFTEYVAIVEFLINKMGRPLEEAMKSADVPTHLEDQVRLYISGSVVITRPDLIVDNTPSRTVLCTEIPLGLPQPSFTSFRKFLLNERKWHKHVVENLDVASADLISRLPDPAKNQTFRSRGLVVGYIQSGKTASMAALISKAADQGYKFFIVLAGLYNDLRAQTQKRMDQEITGKPDNLGDEPVVEHEPGTPNWVRFTRSGIGGDFRPGTHGDLNPQTLKLAVLKKNARVLERFIAWLREASVPLDQIPVLIIDDEADQGSINTNYGKVDDNGDPIDPTAINRNIRALLSCLPKCAYVGYTATPFANVLIDYDVEDDLYPRNFIACLPEPEGYFGPEKLFGLGLDESDISPEAPAPPRLDLIRYIDHDQMVELTHLQEDSDCPQILSDAMLAFLLSCCARLARGQDKAHFTMFVHPSHRTGVHATFANVVDSELRYMKVAVGKPKQFRDFHSRAENMWNEDFNRVTATIPDTVDLVLDFQTIWRFAKQLVEGIEIVTLNSASNDELDYSQGRWKRYIVVGGNRLSRGLTLEGLSISLFIRDTNFYDTLLQMGRWFGFRNGYFDLTRIFVEERTAELFADLARVELELRRDLRKYSRQPNPPSPLQLVPLIRSHPVMAVTSRMKMGAGRIVNISFSGKSAQTVSFPSDNLRALRTNLEVGRTWVAGLQRPQVKLGTEGAHIWKDVPSSRILKLIEDYSFGQRAGVVSRDPLLNYIQRQNQRGELLRWDVMIPKGNQILDLFTWSRDAAARKIKRSPYTEHSIRTLLSPGDIDIWKREAGRTGDDVNLGCLILYLIDLKSLSSGSPALFDDPSRAEDVLGLAFQFPRSDSNVTVQYVAQEDPPQDEFQGPA